MGVLKGHQLGTFARDAVVLDLGDVQRQAERLREAAREQAARILAEAEQEAERRREGAASEGFERGRAEGYEKGLEEGREQGRAEALEQMSGELKSLEGRWDEAAARWEAEAGRLMEEGPEAVLRFALRLAEKVVHRQIEVDRSVVCDQILAALESVVQPRATVRLHPSERERVEQVLPPLLKRTRACRMVDLEEDASIEPGGCVVLTQKGQIDARIETQLRRLSEAIVPGESPVRGEAGESEAVAGDDGFKEGS